MKIIDKSDLLLVLSTLPDRMNFSEEDLGRLLEAYGDDYFIEGNKFVKTSENPNMKNLRDIHFSYY
jgi:hypothetical protein